MAWYPTLVAVDVALARRAGGLFWLDRPRFALGLFAWSAVGWCFFELLNFRIRNWYYVFVPDGQVERWAGIVVSFATVFPALWLAERALNGLGLARRWRIRPIAVTPRVRAGCAAAGVAFFALSLAWPTVLYPLVWGAVTLCLEPWNHRRAPARSLLGDLERGEPGRIVRLLLGGLAVGLLWELYNAPAAGKWIYTVPGFEDWKLFEMPLPGFLGFPLFALDAFVIVQALVLSRLLPPPERTPAGRSDSGPRAAVAAAAAVAFVVAVLVGMDRRTISSTTPRVAEYDVLPPKARAAFVNAGYDRLDEIARASPETLAARLPAARPAMAAAWQAAARLALLRGIGTENAERLWRAGVRSVADLAATDPAEIYARLTDPPTTGPPIREAQVRVWVRAARRASRP